MALCSELDALDAQWIVKIDWTAFAVSGASGWTVQKLKNLRAGAR